MWLFVEHISRALSISLSSGNAPWNNDSPSFLTSHPSSNLFKKVSVSPMFPRLHLSRSPLYHLADPQVLFALILFYLSVIFGTTDTDNFLFFFLSVPHSLYLGSLTGIKPMPPAGEAWSPNLWTTRISWRFLLCERLSFLVFWLLSAPPSVALARSSSWAPGVILLRYIYILKEEIL